MPNPEFLLHEAIHITAHIDALANYNSKRSDLATDITRREREYGTICVNANTQHAYRLKRFNPPPLDITGVVQPRRRFSPTHRIPAPLAPLESVL